jgi:hypothetical protein
MLARYWEIEPGISIEEVYRLVTLRFGSGLTPLGCEDLVMRALREASSRNEITLVRLVGVDGLVWDMVYIYPKQREVMPLELKICVVE